MDQPFNPAFPFDPTTWKDYGPFARVARLIQIMRASRQQDGEEEHLRFGYVVLVIKTVGGKMTAHIEVLKK